jgi:hypothetical protein
MAISSAEAQRRWKARHPKRVKALARKWRAENPDYLKAKRLRPKEKYHKQKGQAKDRGIGWELTFDAWWAMWEPHWDNRGCGINDMVMCRTGDKGPYSPENCRIDTVLNNRREYLEVGDG